MTAYRDEKNNTWKAKFSYKDWQGNTRWTTKRGFETKRDAQAYEHEFKLQKAGNVDMLFGEFVAKYKEELYPRIKFSTSVTKDNIIDNRILPYFSKKKLNDISTSDVIAWQNEMITYKDVNTGKSFTKSYLKTLHNQLSAILNYGVRFYGLKENVAAKVGNMGSDKGIEMNFWTLDEYKKFRDTMMEYPLYYYCFETLYWTGMREGEMPALTQEDIDLKSRTININKTYHNLKGKKYVSAPKTIKSNRTVSIPDFLAEELEDYMGMIHGLEPKDRLFYTEKGNLSRMLTKGALLAGLSHIRVHDLRHSHVSLLIDMGYSAVAIGNRVGHESMEITYRYSHLFPSVQKEMAGSLEQRNK